MEARLKEQAEEYRAAGMTEEAIAEIAAFDLQVMRSDRKYDRHNQSLHPGAGEPGDAPEPGYDGSEMPLEDRLGWLEEIETPALAEALRELKPEMLELLTLFVFEGFTKSDIARRQGCAPQNVATKLLRVRRFLQRRMARPAAAGQPSIDRRTIARRPPEDRRAKDK